MSVEHRSSLLDRLTDQINRLQVIAYRHSVQACSGTSPAPGANAGHDRSSLLLTYARDEALEGNRKKKQGQTCGSVLRRRLGQREGERRVMEERGKCSRCSVSLLNKACPCHSAILPFSCVARVPISSHLLCVARVPIYSHLLCVCSSAF